MVEIQKLLLLVQTKSLTGFVNLGINGKHQYQVELLGEDVLHVQYLGLIRIDQVSFTS